MLNNIRFSGLHLVDISGLTERQREIFGNDVYCTKQGNRVLPTFPERQPLFPLDGSVEKYSPDGQKEWLVYFSNFKRGNAFETQLSRYIDAFERRFSTKKIPHVFDPTLRGEDILWKIYPSEAAQHAFLHQIPGFVKAALKLDAMGPRDVAQSRPCPQ